MGEVRVGCSVCVGGGGGLMSCGSGVTSLSSHCPGL